MPNPDPAAAPAAARSPKRKWIVATALALAALGAGAAVWKGAGRVALEPLSRADFVEITRRSFPLEVVASGDLDAKNKVMLFVPRNSQQQATIAELLPEGTLVKKGTVVCKLNAKALKDEEDRLKLALASAKAALDDALLALSLEKENCASAEQTATDKLESSKTDLKVWEQGTDVQKMRDLKLAIETATRQLEIAQRDNGNNHALFARKFISQSELEKSDIDLLNAREKLESEKLARHIYETFNRPKERREKEIALAQASLANDQSRKQTSGKMAQAQSKVDGAQNALKLQEDALAEVRRALAEADIKAPQDGIVVYGSERYYYGEGPLAPGKTVYSGQPLISLPDTRQMTASLRVSEAQIQSIKVGQEVGITLSARPGRVFPAKVVKKSDTADRNSRNPFLSEYEVTAELPEGIDNDLKPGMNCRGTITTGQVRDALALPAQAVFVDGSDPHCFVDAGHGKVARRKVRTGESSTLYTAVVDGLKPGERVLLRAPTAEEIAK